MSEAESFALRPPGERPSLARESAPRWTMRMSFFAASWPLALAAINCRNDLPWGHRPVKHERRRADAEVSEDLCSFCKLPKSLLVDRLRCLAFEPVVERLTRHPKDLGQPRHGAAEARLHLPHELGVRRTFNDLRLLQHFVRLVAEGLPHELRAGHAASSDHLKGKWTLQGPERGCRPQGLGGSGLPRSPLSQGRVGGQSCFVPDFKCVFGHSRFERCSDDLVDGVQMLANRSRARRALGLQQSHRCPRLRGFP